MRILHTSDWHLGHFLREHTRELEHEAFLGWLLDTLGDQRADALLICGDVFDSSNPSAQAQGAWYRFLATAARRYPALQVVVIGGNHDSAARLEAPAPLLREFRVHVVGGLPQGGGEVEWDRLLVPLRDATGEVVAWVAAVPFLRQSDLPPARESGDADPLVEGMRARYREAVEAARAKAAPGIPIVVTGHCYMSGGVLSELSERKILGGNLHALPADIFPRDVAYVALGHLHCPQHVGKDENIRYSGAPLPLSMGEAAYRNRVCLVKLDCDAPARIDDIPVPRAVPFIRVPKEGAGSPAEVLTALALLPAIQDGGSLECAPFLEVVVRIDAPQPALREDVLKAIEKKAVRLGRLTVDRGDAPAVALPAIAEGSRLCELSEEAVFIRLYRGEYGGDPPQEYIEAFHELLESVRREEGQP